MAIFVNDKNTNQNKVSAMMTVAESIPAHAQHIPLLS
jgi:hypothetical protein